MAAEEWRDAALALLLVERFGPQDHQTNLRQLRHYVRRGQREVEREVMERVRSEQLARTPRAQFTGQNRDDLEKFIDDDASIREDGGLLWLVGHTVGQCVLRPGMWVERDPDTNELRVSQPDDIADLYREEALR